MSGLTDFLGAGTGQAAIYVIAYSVSIVFTLIIELLVAALLGFRDRDGLGAVLGVNLATNPVAVFLTMLAIWLSSLVPGWGGIAITTGAWVLVEALVVLVEWRIIRWVLGPARPRVLALALWMNVASALAGAALVAIAASIGSVG